jgi:large subunit ribosomal protein L22
VRLRGDTLKTLAAKAGVTPEQLAQAVDRTGLEGDKAVSAVKNWMAGRDHPRCKAADITKLAAAVGAAPKDIARFVSRVSHHRGSPRKAKLLIDLIRGRSVDDALNQLSFTTKRAAVNIRKALSAAIADAEQAEADVTALYVVESRVDDGGMMKRFQPKDRGRAHPIEKRFSHITVGVQERAPRA